MPGSANGNGAAGTRVVSMLGGVTGSMRAADPYGVAVQLGQRLRASVRALTAPLYVRDRSVANLLAGHESIRGPLELAAEADVALFGVGDLQVGPPSCGSGLSRTRSGAGSGSRVPWVT